MRMRHGTHAVPLRKIQPCFVERLGSLFHRRTPSALRLISLSLCALPPHRRTFPPPPSLSLCLSVSPLSQHCEDALCNLKDFLPFKCDMCKKMYCLSHRTYAAHKCPRAADKETVMIKCPLCRGRFRLNAGEDPNVTWARHERTECDPSKRSAKKPRCPAPKCREKLVFSNSTTCSKCQKRVCLKHRFETDHDCRRAGSSGSGFLAGLARRVGSGSGGAAGRSTAAPRPAAAPRVVSRPAAATSSSPSTSTTAAAAAAAAAPPPPPTRTSAGTEVCPMCRATFHDVSRLIAHTEAAHAGAGSNAPPATAFAASAAPAASPVSARAAAARAAVSRAAGRGHTSGAGDGSCPFCRFRTDDPVALVQHVDALHRGTTSSSAMPVSPPQDNKKSCAVC